MKLWKERNLICKELLYPHGIHVSLRGVYAICYADLLLMQTVKLYCHRDTLYTRKSGGDAKTLSDLCVKIWGRTTSFNPVSAVKQ